jgi:hypothetical protein
LFEHESEARRAFQALRELGFTDHQLGILVPADTETPQADPSSDLTALLRSARGKTDASFFGDLVGVLRARGVPEGEARFYAEETQEGRTLIVADAGERADQVRSVVLDCGGYDVQSIGRDFVRPGDAGVRGGTGPQPTDLTHDWTDVRSRYEMLWGQHYGTTDQTWEQMEPVYRFAWRVANEAEYRGRPWSEVESSVRREWERARPVPDAVAGSAPGVLAWSDVAGPIHDVWADVAEEASFGAEGGADRRIPRQGTDQSIPARDVVPSREHGA